MISSTPAQDASQLQQQRKTVAMAVFDFKAHESSSFMAQVESYNHFHPLQINVSYFECKLNKHTAALAKDHQVVCIFVNDSADAEVLSILHSLGVRLLTLRSPVTDGVDLKAAKEVGMKVAGMSAYSAHAVAEFAVGMIMTLNRHFLLSAHRVENGNFKLAGLVGFNLHGKTVGVIGTGKVCILHTLYTLIHSFTHSFIHLFTHSLTHSFIHSLAHSLIHSFIHSFTHSFIHSYSFIHSLTHSFMQILIHSLTCGKRITGRPLLHQNHARVRLQSPLFRHST
jgi:hypothetical protein